MKVQQNIFKKFWFIRTRHWSDFWDIPFNCQVTEALYWRWL